MERRIEPGGGEMHVDDDDHREKCAEVGIADADKRGKEPGTLHVLSARCSVYCSPTGPIEQVQ